MATQISIVLPVHNEEKNLRPLYRQLKACLKKISSSHEIVFVNDGSTDQSLSVLKNFRTKDKKVKIINFSRNFGHMAAVSAGLSHATGKKVVLMDSDLQDPPSVIPKLYQKSLEGYDVVYAIKKNRKESALKKALLNNFYSVLNSVSSLQMPPNAGTFSVMDQKVVRILNSLPEKNKYFSGLRFWAGFTQTGITYQRAKRHSGQPIPLKKLTKLALDGIISFSHLPLRFASLLGFLFATLSFIFIIVVIFLRLFFGYGLIGWASTLSAILFIGSIQLITLGIIGEYLARIYDEVKSRPEYIISQKTGFKS